LYGMGSGMVLVERSTHEYEPTVLSSTNDN
jgi:hypothetical protein